MFCAQLCSILRHGRMFIELSTLLVTYLLLHTANIRSRLRRSCLYIYDFLYKKCNTRNDMECNEHVRISNFALI